MLAGFPETCRPMRSARGSLASRSCSASPSPNAAEASCPAAIAGGQDHHLGGRRAASPAAEWLGAPADRAGRVKVEPDLTVPGHPEMFVIGDTGAIVGPDGNPVPGIAPAAKQQGRYVADRIRRGCAAARSAPFRYRHAGNLAQIGKRLAVIDFGRIKLRGALAWWIWGIAHIYFLIGLRHRLSVALSWLWIYVRDQRTARLITQGSSKVGR